MITASVLAVITVLITTAVLSVLAVTEEINATIKGEDQ